MRDRRWEGGVSKSVGGKVPLLNLSTKYVRKQLSAHKRPKPAPCTRRRAACDSEQCEQHQQEEREGCKMSTNQQQWENIVGARDSPIVSLAYRSARVAAAGMTRATCSDSAKARVGAGECMER